jgi:hypothetical protein
VGSRPAAISREREYPELFELVVRVYQRLAREEGGSEGATIREDSVRAR